MNLQGILAFVPVQYIGYATAAISISSILIGVLPAPHNMKTGYAYAWQVLDWIALNFGNGKTAVKAVAKGEVVPVPPIVTITKGPAA